MKRYVMKDVNRFVLLTCLYYSCFQVVDVKITDVSPAYIKPILSALGSHLNSLEFCNCTQLDLQPFVYCTALEKLTFYDGCSFKLQDGDVTLSAGFLPALKNFFSDSCLGSCSGFFETKSILTSLILNCSHIGTEVLIRIMYK